MELKNNKSTWAALATLGVTAIAAGATAIVKVNKKRKERREQAETQRCHLSAEQMMVYNEAVSQFLSLNNRIYELRRHREALQPLIQQLTRQAECQTAEYEDDDLHQLAQDIERYVTTQVPFINACLSTIQDHGMTYEDCVHGPVGGKFDATLDEEPTGADVTEGTPVSFVLKLGYYFPESTIAPHPVKSIVLV